MKGNLVIAQSGGATAVIDSSCCGIVQKALEHPEQIGGVYGSINGFSIESQEVV